MIALTLGDVIDELVSADALAGTIAQRAVAHFISAAITRGVAELPDLREFLARQRAAPHGLDGGLVLGLRSEEVEHARAHAGTRAEDAFEFVGRGLVDGQPAVLEVGDLDEGVRPFDDVGQDVAFRERLVTRRSSVSLSSRSARSARTLLVVSKQAQNMPATLPCPSRRGE